MIRLRPLCLNVTAAILLGYVAFRAVAQELPASVEVPADLSSKDESDLMLHEGMIDGFPTIEAQSSTSRTSSGPFEPSAVVIPSTAKATLVLSLRSQVNLTTERVSFDDVAVCGGDEKVCAAMKIVDLGSVPPPAQKMTLTRDAVELILREEGFKDTFNWQGANTVSVVGASTSLHGDVLVAVLKDEFARLSSERSNLKIRVLHARLTKSPKVWPGNTKILFPQLRDLNEKPLSWLIDNLQGPRILDGEIIHETHPDDPVSFKVQVTTALDAELPVARTALARGHTLALENLEYRWVSLQRRRENYLEDVKALIGFSLKQPVLQGAPISDRMIELPIAITRGQNVKVLVRKGDLLLSASGQALESGAIGHTIRILYQRTKRQLKARIIDAESVEVML